MTSGSRRICPLPFPLDPVRQLISFQSIPFNVHVFKSLIILHFLLTNTPRFKWGYHSELHLKNVFLFLKTVQRNRSQKMKLLIHT